MKERVCREGNTEKEKKNIKQKQRRKTFGSLTAPDLTFALTSHTLTLRLVLKFYI